MENKIPKIEDVIWLAGEEGVLQIRPESKLCFVAEETAKRPVLRSSSANITHR